MQGVVNDRDMARSDMYDINIWLPVRVPLSLYAGGFSIYSSDVEIGGSLSKKLYKSAFFVTSRSAFFMVWTLHVS